ncbi:hypothetical protein MC885_013270, partial [Smutsia gigantea]
NTMASLFQAMFPEAAGMGSGVQPSSAPGEPEKGPGHREASEEGSQELRTQEQRHLAGPGTKQSSWASQEGPGELQAGQDQAKLGSEHGVLPSRIQAAHEGLQQHGSGKVSKDQQTTQQDPGTVEVQGPESCQQGPECQPIPGHQAPNGSDIVQPTEPWCLLDSCGQQLGDRSPEEADTPHIRPQGALPEPSPGEHEVSSQEAELLVPTAIPEGKMANSFPPSTPGPTTSREDGEAVETQPAPEPVPPPEVRDTGEKMDLDRVQKQPQEPLVAAGVQNLGCPRHGFMKCLLEVEEEEATPRRATKAWVLPNRKAPRTLMPVSTSAPSQPLNVSQTPTLAPATAPPWARRLAPAPVGAPLLASASVPALLAPAQDLGWRRTELLHQSTEEPEPYQGTVGARGALSPEAVSDLGREAGGAPHPEATGSYFAIFDGYGEVDLQSLENILLLVGISLTPSQVEDSLMRDGRVGFKDILAVMTDTKGFFCSVELSSLTDMTPPNPHTLLFEILSLLVDMLALPETALEDITK